MQTDWEIARDVFEITVDQAKGSQPSLDEWFQSSSLADLALLMNQRAEGVYLQQQKVGVAAIHMLKIASEMLFKGDLPPEQAQATLSVGTTAIEMLLSTLQSAVNLAIEIPKKKTSIQNRTKANKLHAGHSESKEKLRQLWASGQYVSRAKCAEKESAGLDISIVAGRRCLIGTPDPIAWSMQPRAKSMRSIG